MKLKQDKLRPVMIPALPRWYAEDLKETWDELVKFSGINDEMLSEPNNNDPKQSQGLPQ